MSKKSLIVSAIVIVIAILVILILISAGAFTDKPKNKEREIIQPETNESRDNDQTTTGTEPGVSGLLSVQSAYSIAVAKAKTWHADAVLVQARSIKGETDRFGHSDDWEFLFTSTSGKDQGYKVLIYDRKIISAEEVPYVRMGAKLPDNLITSQEAIAMMREIKGYENLAVESVELVFGDDQKWYWGIKTARGTVSIKAEK